MAPGIWNQTFNRIFSNIKTMFDSSSTPPLNPPVANFSGTPTSGALPLAVSFTDLSTNTPTSWDWDLDDGATSTTQNPSKTYTLYGTKDISLTATNADGSDTETKAAYITVNNTKSCLFDGSNDYLSAGNVYNYTTGTLTVSCWFRADDVTSHSIFSKRQTGGNQAGYVFRLGSGGNPFIVARKNSTNVISSTGGSALSVDTWYHALVVISTTAANHKIYINGSAETLTTTATGTVDTMSNADNFKIGTNNAEYWDGVIDEVSFWDGDQSALLSSLYNGGVPPGLVGSPLSYWCLNDSMADLGSSDYSLTAVNYAGSQYSSTVP